MSSLPDDPTVPAPAHILAITDFAPAALTAILDAVRDATRPAGTQVWIGSYGINKLDAEQITAIADARYAPILCIEPANSVAARAGRPLPPEQAALLPAAYDGPIPANPADAVLPPSDERNWGIELGRRFRDQLRTNRNEGVPIPNWQFDEILGTCGQPGEPSPSRAFVGGVLNGLARGRPELHDQHETGIIWAAWTAIERLPNLPIDASLTQFWEDLNTATRLLAGEEYPPFVGDPIVEAQRYAAAHRALLTSSGPIRRSLGGRYMVGMTPGWKVPGELGGNIENQPDIWVNNWRSQFIQHRTALAHPAGYAQFFIEQENAEPNRINNAISALHQALTAVGIDPTDT